MTTYSYLTSEQYISTECHKLAGKAAYCTGNKRLLLLCDDADSERNGSDRMWFCCLGRIQGIVFPLRDQADSNEETGFYVPQIFCIFLGP